MQSRKGRSNFSVVFPCFVRQSHDIMSTEGSSRFTLLRLPCFVPSVVGDSGSPGFGRAMHGNRARSSLADVPFRFPRPFPFFNSYSSFFSFSSLQTDVPFYQSKCLCLPNIHYRPLHGLGWVVPSVAPHHNLTPPLSPRTPALAQGAPSPCQTWPSDTTST
jgi:hypothetical protein